MARLTSQDIDENLKRLPGWIRNDETIRKQFTFAGFPDAIAFVVRLAFEAEAADHHPDILISYKRVTVAFSTHTEGGITQKDVDGAHAAERLTVS